MRTNNPQEDLVSLSKKSPTHLMNYVYESQVFTQIGPMGLAQKKQKTIRTDSVPRGNSWLSG